jgi:hypothetical protein
MACEENIMNWTGLIQDHLFQRRQLGYELTIDGLFWSNGAGHFYERQYS